MDDKSISISVSADERAFIDRQLASGKYASEEDLLRAGLAALQQALAPAGFSEIDESAPYISENVEQLRRDLSASEASGTSQRQVRDIMSDVKAKLQANGAL